MSNQSYAPLASFGSLEGRQIAQVSSWVVLAVELHLDSSFLSETALAHARVGRWSLETSGIQRYDVYIDRAAEYARAHERAISERRIASAVAQAARIQHQMPRVTTASLPVMPIKHPGAPDPKGLAILDRCVSTGSINSEVCARCILVCKCDGEVHVLGAAPRENCFLLPPYILKIASQPAHTCMGKGCRVCCTVQTTCGMKSTS